MRFSASQGSGEEKGRGIAPSFFHPQAAACAHILMLFAKDDPSSFNFV
jgi:hypothetical protein